MSLDISHIDPTKLSLDGLLVQYNELATTLGIPARGAKFRDKPTGVKAVQGLIAQIKASADLPEDEPAPTPPGRQRLLDSGVAEELRQDVLAGQRAAIANVAAARPTVDPFAATPARDLPPANEAEARPVAPAQRGPKSKAPADTATLEVLVDNPKREEDRKARFACYGGGMKGNTITVGDYIRAVSDPAQARRDIVRDIRKGYIRVAS